MAKRDLAAEFWAIFTEKERIWARNQMGRPKKLTLLGMPAVVNLRLAPGTVEFRGRNVVRIKNLADG